MEFSPIDPDKARRLLDGHEDVITGRVAARTALIEAASCPSCGKTGSKAHPDRNRPFDGLIPRFNAQCSSCQCLFDPDTKKIL